MELLLGKSKDEAITVALPTIIQSLGNTGSGRHEFMIELARQAMLAGAGVIFVNSCSDSISWFKIYGAAEAAGRHEECYAKSPVVEDLLEVSVPQIVLNSAILWYGPPALGKAPIEYEGELSQFLSSLTSAILLREQDAKPLVVILDGIISRSRGLPAELQILVAKSGLANTTLVFSDQSAAFLDASVVENASCHIFQRAVDVETQALADRMVDEPTRLSELEAGDAVVLLGGMPTRRAIRMSMTYTEIKHPGYVRPANSAKA